MALTLQRRRDMRASSLAIALTLASVVTLTGCDALFCDGDVDSYDEWTGDLYSGIKLSGADGVTLVTWVDAQLNAATIEGGVMLHRIEPSSVRELPSYAVASAPNGHVLVVPDRSGPVLTGLVATSLDRRGQVVGQISIAEVADLHPAVAFDGERFLIAWGKDRKLMLTSLVPGAAAPSSSVVVGTIPSGASLCMASGGGVTWITWPGFTRVEGIRVVDGAAVDPAPVVLLDDSRLMSTRVAMAWSSDRFLLAVTAALEGRSGPPGELKRGSLLVPIDGGGAAPGAVVELPGYIDVKLAGEAAGFTALQSSSDDWHVRFGEHTQAPLALAHLALDGALQSEVPIDGNFAAFASDGGRISLAVRTDSTEDGSSVLSFGTLDEPSTIPLATVHLKHDEGVRCSHQ